MSKISEKGHAKTVANFKTLIAFLQTIPAYKPSYPLATLPSLNALYTESEARLAAMSTAEAAYNNAVKAQQLAFKALPKFATRLVSGFKGVAADQALTERAISLGRQITSTRPGNTPEAGAPAEAALADTNVGDGTVSTSHHSYDNQASNLKKLIDVLKAASFNPNEPEFKIPALVAYHQQLKTLTEAVDPVQIALFNARNLRNQTLYNPTTGIIEAVDRVKLYLKSTFGVRSPQLKFVTALKFTSRP